MENEKNINELYDDAQEVIGNGADILKDYAKSSVVSDNLFSNLTNIELASSGDVTNDHQFSNLPARRSQFESQYSADEIYEHLIDRNTSDKVLTDIFIDTVKENLYEQDPNSELLRALENEEVNIVLKENLTKRGMIGAYYFAITEIQIDKNAAVAMIADKVFESDAIFKGKKNDLETRLRFDYPIASYQDEDVRDVVENGISQDIARVFDHEGDHYLKSQELEKHIGNKFNISNVELDLRDLDPKTSLRVAMGVEISARLAEGKGEFEKGGVAWDTLKDSVIPETGKLIEDYAKENNFKVGEKIPAEHIQNIDEMLYDSFIYDNVSTTPDEDVTALDRYKKTIAEAHIAKAYGNGDQSLSLDEVTKALEIDHVVKNEDFFNSKFFITNHDVPRLGLKESQLDSVCFYDVGTKTFSGLAKDDKENDGASGENTNNNSVDMTQVILNKLGNAK